MRRLEEFIAPDEPVEWRSSSLRGWVVEMVKILALTAGVPITVAVLLEDMDLAMSSTIAPALGLAFVLRIARRGPAEALLTRRQLVVRRRIRWPQLTVLERRDITHVEIFGTENELVLYGRRGELFRAVLLDDPLDLARSLDLPTAVWADYEPSKWARRTDYLLMFTLPLVALAVTVAAVASVPDSLFEAIRVNVAQPARPFAALSLVLSLFVVSWLPALVSVGFLRRLVLSREDLDAFRCHKFNQLWQGRNPGRTKPAGLMRRTRLALDRLINGALPTCTDIEPTRYEPGRFPLREGNAEVVSVSESSARKH